MGKKKLTMKFKIFMDDYPDFANVDDLHPTEAGEMLDSIRKGLNKMYEITTESDPVDIIKGFTNLTINSFNAIDIEVEDIPPQ